MARSPKSVIATTYVTVEQPDGTVALIPPGSRLAGADPIVKQHPDAFEPERDDSDPEDAA